MECALEGAHAVLEKHDEKFLLDDRGSVMERQQVGERIGVILRLGEDIVLIQA